MIPTSLNVNSHQITTGEIQTTKYETLGKEKRKMTLI
jgi:hypothetical protein